MGSMTSLLTDMTDRIAADPGARFAVSLTPLAYAKDNHVIGSGLVRNFGRNADRRAPTGHLAQDVATRRAGMQALPQG